MARSLCASCYSKHKYNGTLESFGKQRTGVIIKPGRSTNYRYIRIPDHPLAHKDGFVAEHRLVAWENGLLSNLNDEVHHKNGDGLDNRIENLEVMSPMFHRREHASSDGTVNQYGWNPPRSESCRLCGRPARNADLCIAHVTRLNRYGNPLAVKRVTPSTIEPYSTSTVRSCPDHERLSDEEP